MQAFRRKIVEVKPCEANKHLVDALYKYEEYKALEGIRKNFNSFHFIGTIKKSLYIYEIGF